ncbi:MAG: tRNA (adenosine(37)-N6)-threonylcarbamoyltransferase complex transferase subunit TsaD [Bernardetiaceae bacterium]|nr:tRNA (adenosine(37)-N6)-threonylcarbamoyltransferase complex transferase subunit TsaD [Bernardetiaceae bacterium]
MPPTASLNILAIESSCDETAAAVLSHGKLLSHVVASQSVHETYGGVVPELASRAHEKNIIPVVHQALSMSKLSMQALDAIAFTQGPGLLGALLVGTSFAKSLAWSLDIPLIPVNHMHAHILAHFIEEPTPEFPFLCLTVSGGHTQLVWVSSPTDLQVIGETQDDAVGEAFDKTAKLLGLPYPGGVYIDKHAQRGKVQDYELPEVNMEGFDFSFSGIKTAILYFLRKQIQKDADFITKNIDDICATVQDTLVRALLRKLIQAAEAYKVKHIAIAGGVSANSGLRKALHELSHEKNWTVHLPKLEYCTDNAAMIAMAAHYLYKQGSFTDIKATPLPRMPLPVLSK